MWTPRKFHIELTNACAARCPFCARTQKIGSAQHLELSLKEIKKFFTPELLLQTDVINLCGTYGDPIYTKDFLDIVTYFHLYDVQIYISTNGYNNQIDFWELLGSMKNLTIIFGIDGTTQETHGQHRVGTQLVQILRNAKKYIQAGGRAEWQFIVFGTNEHQIVTAKTIAKKMGFSDFKIMFSRGYTKDLPEPTINLEAAGVTRDFSGTDYICRGKREKEWYITCFGQVLPCCYLGELEHSNKYLLDEKMNIKNSSLNEIQFYKTWSNQIGKFLRRDGINMCLNTCGTTSKDREKVSIL